MTIRILNISSPTDDRGPGVMYRNHKLACSETDDFEVRDMTQSIWSSDSAIRSFDFAWGYVRFQPFVLQRLRSLDIPVVGGPNIAMESAHDGITDEYERWYLTKSDVQMNLNVAKYYSDYVASFVKNGMRCEVLEGCYDVSKFESQSIEKDIDVLLYHKVRTNDTETTAGERLTKLKSELDSMGLRTQVLRYGNYKRDEYINLCARSKTVAWLSIEDYASLAQIEAHLSGACVIGTPYNLTIPAIEESLCMKSQVMNRWITWRDVDVVTKDYVETVAKVLAVKDLESIVKNKAVERHSFETYRKNLLTIATKLVK
jgi:hypothetical protein